MKKLALIAFLSVAPAQADVFFLSEASGEPGVRVTAEVVVTDEAYASGLDVFWRYDSRRFPSIPQEPSNLDGLQSLTFTLTDSNMATFRVYTLQDFTGVTNPSVFIPYINAITLMSVPFGLPTLEVSLLNFEDFFGFSTTPTASSGFFVSDQGYPCQLQPNQRCQFTGGPLTFVAVPNVAVPEPASLALLGTALLGLALLRQRPRGMGKVL